MSLRFPSDLSRADSHCVFCRRYVVHVGNAPYRATKYLNSKFVRVAQFRAFVFSATDAIKAMAPPNASGYWLVCAKPPCKEAIANAQWMRFPAGLATGALCLPSEQFPDPDGRRPTNETILLGK